MGAVCQALDGFDVFNMQTFDQIRDKSQHLPAVQALGDDSSFSYKTCGSHFKMDKETTGCESKKGSAFLVQNGVCVNSFDSAIFTPHKNPAPKETDISKNDGFYL